MYEKIFFNANYINEAIVVQNILNMQEERRLKNELAKSITFVNFLKDLVTLQQIDPEMKICLEVNKEGNLFPIKDLRVDIDNDNNVVTIRNCADH